jgi:2-polyprenyl-3-methyl-5-hydroxy-6-metoxy-1,4-benzoquinol methylase/HAMP domain-containing protein
MDSLDRFLSTAEQHRQAGVRLGGPTRFTGLKKLILRAARLYTSEQVGYNEAVLGALRILADDLASNDAIRRVVAAQASVASIELTVTHLADRIGELERSVKELDQSLRGVDRSLRVAQETDHGELATQRALLEVLLARVKQQTPEEGERTGPPYIDDIVQARSDDLYSQLETAFRGTREQVLELQRVYLPDVRRLKASGAPVLDIGCGRGEWLELLREDDIPAYGVDLNDSVAQQDRARGLDVRTGDAVEHMRSVEPSSLAAVTGFHVIEHLPFETLVALLDAALVAIRPGGMVIFETPNPTNLIVGAASFYTDPTHRNPLHPDFTKFLLTARGYVDTEIRYLHPRGPASLNDPGIEGLDEHLKRALQEVDWAIFGPQDYGVIAYKPPPPAP